MKLTLKQHKIECLKYARRLIESKEETFICYAVARYEYSDRASNYMVEYINDSIYPYNNLAYWVNSHTGKKYQSCYGPAMQKIRLAYIDWMIACYEDNIK